MKSKIRREEKWIGKKRLEKKMWDEMSKDEEKWEWIEGS